MHRKTLLSGDDVSFSWSTNTGFTSNEKNISTNVSLISDITYKCEVKRKDENGQDVIGNAVKEIKIDMEKPVIGEIKVDTNWSTCKTIEIIANDGMGSGVGGYAVVSKNKDCSNFKTNNKVSVNENGDYKICVKDKAGNINSTGEIKIETIDKEYPFIEAKASKFEIDVGTNNKVIDYFNVTYSASGGTTTCNYEATNNLEVGEHTLTCTATGGNGLKKSASTTLIVKPLIPGAPTIVTKYNAASGNIYNGEWTSQNVYVEITPGRNNDIVTSYQYRLDSGNWTTPTDLKINGNNGSFTFTRNMQNPVMVRACNEVGCSGASNDKAVRIDKNYPTISAKSSSNTITVGTDNKSTNYFNISYSISGGTTTCNYENVSGLSVGTYTLTCTAVGGNGLKAYASTKVVVKPTVPLPPTITTRLNNSSGSAYDSSWTSQNVYVAITPGKTSDVVTSYQYRVGSGSWITPGNLKMNGYTGNFTINTNTNGNVSVRACNEVGCSSASSAKTIKIDKTAPTINVNSLSKTITVGTNNKASAYFNVTYSISGGTTICTPATTGSLAIGNHEISCTATGGSGLKSTAKFTLKVIASAPSAPSIITKYRNASGSTYSGSWTNKTIYIGITPGATGDTITTYQYKFESDSSWKSISWLSLNSDKSGSFTYSNEVNDTIYVRACNGSNCSGSSNGKLIRIDTTDPDIWCDGSGAYMIHGGYSRSISVSGCSAYGTFRSGIEASSTFGEYVFGYDEGSLSTYITYYDDRGYSGSDADWRGSRGRCTSSYCMAVVTGCATDVAGNSACTSFTYYVSY